MVVNCDFDVVTEPVLVGLIVDLLEGVKVPVEVDVIVVVVVVVIVVVVVVDVDVNFVVVVAVVVILALVVVVVVVVENVASDDAAEVIGIVVVVVAGKVSVESRNAVVVGSLVVDMVDEYSIAISHIIPVNPDGHTHTSGKSFSADPLPEESELLLSSNAQMPLFMQTQGS